MLKPISSRTSGVAFASRIACRNEPAPAFAVVVTARVVTAVAGTHAENSDVLFVVALVAVAVMKSLAVAGPNVASKVARPASFVVTRTDPRNDSPSPNPDGSQAVFLNTSSANPVRGVLVSEPRTRVACPASTDSMTG